MRATMRTASMLIAAGAGMSACTTLFGEIDFKGKEASGGGGGSSSSTSSSAGGGGGSSTSTSTTSTTTSSGGGAGGGMVCTPTTTMACYEGPAGTENVGSCKGGTQTCNANGTAWGPCTGQVVPATEACPSATDTDCSGYTCGQTKWAFAIPGVQLKAVAVDGAGNTYLAGNFGATFSFPGGMPLVNAGGTDVVVAKLDVDGKHVWSKRFGDGQNQAPTSLAVDAQGNVFVSGGFTGQIDFGGGGLSGGTSISTFIAKLDSSGAHLWSKRFTGTASVYRSKLAADPSGSVLLMGDFRGTADLGAGNVTSKGEDDVFLIKLAGNGTVVWSKAFGTLDYDFSGGVAVDGAGSVFTTGSFVGTMVVGATTLASAGGTTDMFLIKFDTSGNVGWAKKFGDSSQAQRGVAISVDPLGNVYTAGRFAGTMNLGGSDLITTGNEYFLAKHNGMGSHQWSLRAGGDDPYGTEMFVAVDAAGNVAAGGYFYTTIQFGGSPLVATPGTTDQTTDVFAASVDSAGGLRWQKRYGDSDYQSTTGVAVHPASGDMVVIGGVAGAIDFGLGPLQASGSSGTAFVARIAR